MVHQFPRVKFSNNNDYFLDNSEKTKEYINKFKIEFQDLTPIQINKLVYNLEKIEKLW
tara:strand:+ start:464 stop:637 length:174 start_codon:yes stop_codon:yes gene_type:complete